MLMEEDIKLWSNRDIWDSFERFKELTGWKGLDAEDAVESFVHYIAGDRAEY